MKNKIITEEVAKKTQSVNNSTAARNNKIPLKLLKLLKYVPDTLLNWRVTKYFSGQGKFCGIRALR